MDWKLEVIVVPVSDVDRAKAFYGEKLGFRLDVDHAPNDQFRVVQYTPPGSACSITFGVGVTQVEPGTYQGMHLVVDDIEAAHAHLKERGVECSEPFHFGSEGRTEGLDPDRRDFGTYIELADPDGNGWLVQEAKHGNPDR